MSNLLNILDNELNNQSSKSEDSDDGNEFELDFDDSNT